MLLVCPEYLPMKVAIDEEGNEYQVVDQSELISPVAKIYEEKHIAGYKAGEYALLWNGKDGDRIS